MIRLTSNIPKVYSATHYFNNIPLIDSCVITGAQSGALMLKISVLCEKKEVLSFSESFTVQDYQKDAVVLPLGKYKLFPDEKYINSEAQPSTLQVRMAVNDGFDTATYACGVHFLPFGNIAPEMAPELLCTYIMPGLSFASRISRAALESCGKNPTAPIVARELFSLLLSEKLSFAKHLSDLPENSCIIRDYENIINSINRSVTMTEAALIFCSCAERIGLDTTLIYLRKGAGNIRVLVGIILDKRVQSPIFSESIKDLREQIINKDIICFDVIGFLGTEDTDFYKNLQETHDTIFKSNSSLAFCVNVSGARLCGIKSLHPIKERSTVAERSNTEIIKDAIIEIKKKDILNTVYSFTPTDNSVLALCTVKEPVIGEDYTLLALDDDIFTQNPDTIGKFTSFKGRYPTDIPRNLTETTKYNAKLSALSEKLLEGSSSNYIYSYPLSYFLSCDKTSSVKIREEFLSCIAMLSEKFSKVGCGEFVKLYAANGIIEFSKGEKTLYSPCVFVPCELYSEKNAVKLRYGSASPIINKSLFAQLAKEFGRTDASYDLSPSSSIAECIAAFAGLCERSQGRIILHKDILLSAFDLSFTLMKNCIESSSEAGFGKYLENGKYEKSENGSGIFGRFEATLPFEVSSAVKNAVKAAESDSIIISGLPGTGKKEAAANIIAREAQKGGCVFVSSRFSDSLYSLRSTFEDAGLSELCLIVENSESTKAKILADIRKFTEIPPAPDKVEGDIGELENKLDVFASELYHTYDFGYSLHTCIDEYCRSDAENKDKPLEITIEAGNMTREISDKVFAISGQLSESAGNIYAELPKKNITECGLSYIKTVNEIPEKRLSELILSSKEKLLDFTEKCSFIFKSFGISEKDICDVRSFVAFGDFLELIMNTGINGIPEKLFSDNLHKNLKFLETLCDILSKIKKAQNDACGIYEKLTSDKADEFYNKWFNTDSNIFAKNAIIHEMREYLPKKIRLTHSKAKTILLALREKEKLEKELASYSDKAHELLCDIWKGTATDAEGLYKILAFAQNTDNYIGKIFKAESLCESILSAGVPKLIGSLFESKEIKADFISALSVFRKLCDKGFSEGLLPEISNILTLDMYELKFENGVLGKNGLSDYLSGLNERMSALALMPKYNSIKKEALSLGLSAFAEYLENNYNCENASVLFFKSIYYSFIEYILNSKECFKNGDIAALRKQYSELFDYEKKLAAYNLTLQRRRSFIKYISSESGKSETYAFCESLRDRHCTLQEIFSKHSSILRAMYSAIFAVSDFAYTLDKFPKTLILLDSEKTTASQALPLCASFDKCIFLSSGALSENSIVALLPVGLERIELSKVSSHKNCDFAKFAKHSLGIDLDYTEDISDFRIKLVKCDGGLYDKNSGANKIEAVQVCETALSICREHGYENVGIITMTSAQRNETEVVLELLAAKYSDDKIKNIPVRYIGAMGDLSKKYIVLSLTFGKNIYSVTRSFDLLSSPYLIKSGNFSPLSELLCCEKELYLVTSIDDSEIMLDGKLPGAADIYSLLLYASKGAMQPLSETEEEMTGKNIKDCLCERLEITNTKRSLTNILYKNGTAYLFDNGYIRDIYDRERLPECEVRSKGCRAEFLNICDLV